jgi:hypothetical protein
MEAKVKEKLPITKMVLFGTTAIGQASASALMANLFRAAKLQYLF